MVLLNHTHQYAYNMNITNLSKPTLCIKTNLPAEGAKDLVLLHFTAWFNDV